MILSSSILPANAILEADICIIGAGPAGITLAMEFDAQPFRVVVLEGGGLKYDRAGQALYTGENAGLHYEDLHYARSRFFGGSSNCWAGFCRPFDAHDFEAREWVPNSGWPITRADLDPHYHRAHELLELGPVNYDPDTWENWIDRADARLIPFERRRAINVISQVSPPTRFGRRYRDAVASSQNVSTYLDSSVVEIETPDTGALVTGVRARSLDNKEFRVVARTYILAAGGIETPRLLLASNRFQPAGVGNQHDVVGRYFMDHPRLRSGEIVFRDPDHNSRIYDMHSTFIRKVTGRGVKVSGFFGLTPEVQRAERIGNTRCCVKSSYVGDSRQTNLATLTLFRAIGERRSLLDRSGPDLIRMITHFPHIFILAFGLKLNLPFLRRGFTLETVVEPTPLPDSRVTLTTERDALGVPRVKLDWRLGDLEKRTIRRTQEILGKNWPRSGTAKFWSMHPAMATLGPIRSMAVGTTWGQRACTPIRAKAWSTATVACTEWAIYSSPAVLCSRPAGQTRPRSILLPSPFGSLITSRANTAMALRSQQPPSVSRHRKTPAAPDLRRCRPDP